MTQRVEESLFARLTTLGSRDWSANDTFRSRLEPAEVGAIAGVLGRLVTLPFREMIGRNALSFATSTGLRYPTSESEAEELAASGTAILQKLEGFAPILGRLSRRLESRLHSHATIAAYVSTGSSESIGRHVDEWDNIVIQVSGVKVFHFLTRSERLDAGDVLTIPQGLHHEVETEDASVHLSVVLLRRRWMQDHNLA